MADVDQADGRTTVQVPRALLDDLRRRQLAAALAEPRARKPALWQIITRALAALDAAAGQTRKAEQ